MLFLRALLLMCTLSVIYELTQAQKIKKTPQPTKVSDVARLINTFGKKIYQRITVKNPNKNVVFSPFSVFYSLSILLYASQETTQTFNQLFLVLGGINLPYTTLLNELNNMNQAKINVATKMFVKSDFNVRNIYKQVVEKHFHASVEEFGNNAVKTANKVNEWVDKSTNHQIRSIIKSDDIDAFTKLMLINVIYLKAEWANKFSADSNKNINFYAYGNKRIKVPAMTTETEFVYADSKELNAQYIELPYTQKDLKMIIIVPREVKGLPSLLKKLQYTNTSILGAEPSSVTLVLPKFNIQVETDFKPILERMGVTDIFNDKARLDAISEQKLKVDKLFQKATISVNEKGTEASAATFASISNRFQSEQVLIDRPFYFAIKSNQGILFEGHVVNPLVN